MILRDYQRGILNAPEVRDIVHKVRTGEGPDGLSTLVVSPTGSGKTAMFAALAGKLMQSQKRILFIAHRQEILEQISSALHYIAGVSPGIIAAGSPVTRNLAQIGMIQTIVKRLPYLLRPDLIIADEAHHYQRGTNEWGRVLDYFADVPRLGWTATPELLSGVGLGASYDRLVMGPQTADLVRSGWLAQPRMLCAPSELLGVRYHTERGDWSTREQAEKVRERRVVGDQIDQYRQFFGGDPCVGFAPTLEIAEEYVKAFCDAGLKARMVWGNMDKTDRDRAFRELADGSINILWNHSIITEGVDVPVTRGVILLRKTQSLALYLQMCGRALRPVWPEGFDPNEATDDERRKAIARAGKPDAIILDPVGNYQTHGHVLAPRTWTLDAVSRADRKENPPVITRCPACFGVWAGRPRVCPDCGYDLSAVGGAPNVRLKQVAGELIEVGVDGQDASGLAGMYDAAMRMEAKERGAFLAKRGVEMLKQAVEFRERPSEYAWRARGGRS